jgi:hypothetical protein
MDFNRFGKGFLGCEDRCCFLRNGEEERRKAGWRGRA